MNMSDLIAKPVVKNKFWVVEDDGKKIATIQAIDDGSCVYVHDDQREHFPSVTILKKKYHIKFGTVKKPKTEKITEIYGYPISGRAYNIVYDVQRKLAVYSKTQKSKSLFCAGYFILKLDDKWETIYCPKNITVNRHEYFGPFKTETEMNNKFKELQNECN
jgi:hypothetical protein